MQERDFSDEVENRIYWEQVFDEIYKRLTPMENAILLWHQWGYTNKEIMEHFEIYDKLFYPMWKEVKRKILEVLEEQKNENLCDLW